MIVNNTSWKSDESVVSYSLMKYGLKADSKRKKILKKVDVPLFDRTDTPTIDFRHHSTPDIDGINTLFNRLGQCFEGEKTLTVDRRTILRDLLFAYKDATIVNKRLKVVFDGESGDDLGGLTKTSLRLLEPGSDGIFSCGRRCGASLASARLQSKKERQCDPWSYFGTLCDDHKVNSCKAESHLPVAINLWTRYNNRRWNSSGRLSITCDSARADIA